MQTTGARRTVCLNVNGASKKSHENEGEERLRNGDQVSAAIPQTNPQIRSLPAGPAKSQL
ncbi:hypothetical protein Trco_006996 [Trichoderma cornu-damae]|uniref:Uncharacterized protein n=1 Tax=Trichoderma cornu-damae TaxID=654480 RepID=A0A9P8TVJ4_9HYPO|nr:hypothetical protein Trco_006996 [Trichoderma cornu-damae]